MTAISNVDLATFGALLALVAAPAVGQAQGAQLCGAQPVTVTGMPGPDSFVDASVKNPAQGAILIRESDVVSSGAGDDVLEFSLERVVICAEAGSDQVRVLAGPDQLPQTGPDLKLGVGDDQLRAERGAGGVGANGGGGADTLITTGGRDSLFGARQNDVIKAGLGKDEVFGGGGDDRLLGGPKAGRLEANASDSDEIDGNGGDDLLEGGFGEDVLEGLAGDDQLFDGSASKVDSGSRDRLSGGDGDDRLRGDEVSDIANGDDGRVDRCRAWRERLCEL